jgi:hypothetical protein
MATALAVAAAFVVLLLAVLVVGLLRSHAEILKALHDLGVNLEDGAPARAGGRRPAVSSHPPARTADGVPGPREAEAPLGPAVDITGTLPDGGSAHVAVTGTERSTLLAFLSTGCGTCGVFWDALRHLDESSLPGIDTRVVIVTNGVESESLAAVADLAPPGLLTVLSDAAWDDYEIPVSPYFVLADGRSGRVVGEGSGTSWGQILDLLGRAAADARLGATRSKPPLTRMGGQDRADWVDAQLAGAGIEPGHPSLHPDEHPSHAGAEEARP